MGSSPYSYLVAVPAEFSAGIGRAAYTRVRAGAVQSGDALPPFFRRRQDAAGAGSSACHDRGGVRGVRRRRHAVDSGHSPCRERSRFRRGPSPDRRGTARALRDDDAHPRTNPRGSCRPRTSSAAKPICLTVYDEVGYPAEIFFAGYSVRLKPVGSGCTRTRHPPRMQSRPSGNNGRWSPVAFK